MQVNNIQAHNTSFGAMLITPKGRDTLRRAFLPEQIKQITKWSKDLKSTKHFDLEISAVTDELFYTFRHITNPSLNCEAPLYPVEVKSNQLQARGVDLLDCGDIFTYNNLQLPTPREAGEAYSRLSRFKQFCTPYKRNDFNRLAWAVESTKILDNATEYTGSDNIRQVVKAVHNKPVMAPVGEQKTEGVAKTSFTQRLKKAWQILKGN